MDNIIVYDMIDINSYVETLNPATFNGVIGVDINRFNIEFIKLLAGIYKLADNNVTNLSKQMKPIKILTNTIPEEEPEININTNIDDIIFEVKISLGNLMLIYNDLYKIFVDLYNLQMAISTQIDNSDSEVFKQIYESIKSNHISIDKSEMDSFAEIMSKKYNFTPLIYDPNNLINLNLGDYDLKGLEIIGNLFLDKIAFVKQNINELLIIANKFIDNYDVFQEKLNKGLEHIARSLKKKITKPLVGGVKIDEAKTKLLELKDILDTFNINNLSIKDITIPKGINLTINELDDMLKIFKTKAELLQDSTVKFNMIEDIPNYLSMPKDGIIGNLQPSIPDIEKQISNIDDIIEKLNEKNKINSTKITDINNILLQIDLNNKNLTSNINIQSSREYIFSLSNIGSIDDLKNRYGEIDDIITKLKDNISKLDEDKKLLLQQIFKEYTDNKKQFNKIIKDNPDIEKNIRLIPYKLKIAILFFFKEFDELEKASLTWDNFQKDELDKLIFYEDSINKIKFNDKKLKILDDISRKMNKIDNFGYESGFFLNENFYTNYMKTHSYINSLHEIIKKQIRNKMPISGQNKNKAIDAFIDTFEDVRTKTAEIKKIYKDIITEFIWTINQDITISLIRMNELINKIKADPKLKLYLSLLESLENLEITNSWIKQLYEKHNLDKIGNIEDIIRTIDDSIRRLEEEIRKLLEEKKIIEDNIKSFGKLIEWDSVFELNDVLITRKINLFKTNFATINSKLKTIYELKYGNPNYKQSLSDDIIAKFIDINNKDWLYNIIQSGGYNPIKNIQNINKFNILNDALKRYMKTLEKIRYLSTELLIIYEKFLDNYTSIIVYLLYRINVLKIIKNKMFKIPSVKFDKIKLEQLKIKILGNKKENLSQIKKIFTNIITNIIIQLEKENKKYVDLNPENKSILIIFILYHLDHYI